MRVALALLLVAISGCQRSAKPERSTGGETVSPETPTAAASPATPPTTRAPPVSTKASPPSAVGAPAPALAQFTQLVLRQGQGGPRLMRCGGTVFQVSIDLATNRYEYGSCQSQPTDPPTAPLTKRSGRLTSAQRAELETEYAKLSVGPAPGCGHDGGTLSLTLEGRDGATTRYVDQNWGCRKPPPTVAFGLRELGLVLGRLTMQ